MKMILKRALFDAEENIDKEEGIGKSSSGIYVRSSEVEIVPTKLGNGLRTTSPRDTEWNHVQV